MHMDYCMYAHNYIFAYKLLGFTLQLTGIYSNATLLLQRLSIMTATTTGQFSAHSSQQLLYNCVELLITNSIAWFDTGWVLCNISMVFFLIPFKPQIGTHVYYIYMPIFNWFFPEVYPSIFVMWKINHSTVNLLQIPTKNWYGDVLS